MKVLVVENERDLNRLICEKLRSENYVADGCFDGLDALEYLTMEQYDGAVLDVMLPGLNGFDLLKALRSQGNQTPVIFLTAKKDTKDVVTGLDLGASDYVTKPFKFSELLARLRVLFRTQTITNENIIKCGEIVVNTNECTVYRNDQLINLTSKEYSLFLYLVRNKNVVLSREQIEANIWDMGCDISSNVVDVYIRFIRKKLNNGFDQELIHTVRGMGYVFRCEN